jgi:hypothetical protein
MEEENDILGDLSYVAANPDMFDKEAMVSVLKAAIAEIIELRMLAGLAASRAPDAES